MGQPGPTSLVSSTTPATISTTLAQVPSLLPLQEPTTTVTASPVPEHSDLSTGAKAGIFVATILGSILLVLAGLFVIVRRRRIVGLELNYEQMAPQQGSSILPVQRNTFHELEQGETQELDAKVTLIAELPQR